MTVTREIEAPSAADLEAQVEGTAPTRLAMLGRRARRLSRFAAFKAAEYKVHRSLPGIAGVALVSSAVGGIFGFWYGIGTLGLFCLRIDNRM